MKYRALDAMTDPMPNVRQLLLLATANRIAIDGLPDIAIKVLAYREAAEMLDDALEYLIELTPTGWSRFIADVKAVWKAVGNEQR